MSKEYVTVLKCRNYAIELIREIDDHELISAATIMLFGTLRGLYSAKQLYYHCRKYLIGLQLHQVETWVANLHGAGIWREGKAYVDWGDEKTGQLDFCLCAAVATGQLIKKGDYFGLPEWNEQFDQHLPQDMEEAIKHTRPFISLPYELEKALLPDLKNNNLIWILEKLSRPFEPQPE